MMSKKYMHTSTADSARIVKKGNRCRVYVYQNKKKKKTTTTKNTSIKIYIY